MRKLKYLLALLIVSVAVTVQAQTSATFAWDASPSLNVTNYTVYVGTASRSYTTSIRVALATTTIIQNLVPGRTYYFAATSTDVTGLEGDYTNEIVYTVPGVKPLPPANFRRIAP